MDKYPNLDALINWPEFYGRYIKTPITPAGENKMNACCPFGTHKDKHPSFWFSVDKGLFKCESCGVTGNGTVFLSMMENITTKKAYKKLCELAGVEIKPQTSTKTYTLKEYALEKRLPLEFLATLGLRNGHNNRHVEIPYQDARGGFVSIRKRMPIGARQRFLWNKGSKVIPYGLWRLQDAKDLGHVVLVEGESDAQTLWYLGLPALGMPGASTFNVEHAKYILDIPVIYLHVENDHGGQTAKRKVAQSLLDAGYKGVVKIWSCAVRDGHKDPSALYCANGDNAAMMIQELLRNSKAVNLGQIAMGEMPGLEDAPIKLRIPSGYELNARGVFEVDSKTGIAEPEPFCWTPILITSTVLDVEGTERMAIAFHKAGHWLEQSYPRDMLMSARSIIKLSSVGADVNSENASGVVRWLSALERDNADLIPKQRSVSRYGWIDDKHFVPGAAGEYRLNTDKYTHLGNAGKVSGTLDEWLKAMQPHRQRALFRFILAASFAAPLLKSLGQRIFILYNWGDSKGGKTAALMSALSVWGDPDDLRVSFNSTNVALERTIGFMVDLPLGINERQLAGSKQDSLDRLVYTLSEGQGRGRGTRDGGLQEQRQWRSVIIANGEEPLTTEASQTGISSRAIEIYGKPFESEDEAAAIYDIVVRQHGHAGLAYIQRLVVADHKAIRQRYEALMQKLSQHGGRSRTYVSAITTVCVADELVSRWLYGASEDQAQTASERLGQVILDMLDDAEPADVNERAYNFICDWISSNRKQFTDDFTGATRLGMFDRAQNPKYVYVNPAEFDEALRRKGFAPMKTKKWLADKDILEVHFEADKLRYTTKYLVDGVYTRGLKLRMPEQNQHEFVEVPGLDMPF